MIAEKVSDMIKGKQLDPYEPDQGKESDESYAASSPLHRAHSRSAAAAPSNPAPSKNSNQKQQPPMAARSAPEAKQQQQQPIPSNQTTTTTVYLQALNQLNQEHHNQFMHAKYGSSIIGDGIMKRIL